MPLREMNFRSLPIGQTLNPLRAGPTIIAFQSPGTTGSSSRRDGRSPDLSHSAIVLPFLRLPSSPSARPLLTRSQSASARRPDQNLIAREQEYRQRMFVNVLAAVWVGILMSAGYWMLKVLAVPA